MIAASAQPTPKTAAPANSTPIRGFARLAASSAPATDPIAMIDVSSPYWLAPA